VLIVFSTENILRSIPSAIARRKRLVTVINGVDGSHDVFTICRVSGETIDCVQPEITIRSQHPGHHDGMAVYHCLRVMPLDAFVTQPVIIVRVETEDAVDVVSQVNRTVYDLQVVAYAG
jgi:hypothetical protein